MPLTDEEERTYRQTLEVAQRQLEEIDEKIELEQVKERLAGFQEKHKAALQMYDAACTMLGIEIELEHTGEEGLDQEPQI